MSFKEDEMKAAENCQSYESIVPFVTNVSSMCLSCNSCIHYNYGKCSKKLAEEINNSISVN